MRGSLGVSEHNVQIKKILIQKGQAWNGAATRPVQGGGVGSG